MVENDDKYADDEENLTQVRSIIKQLNEDKPSQERTREVVVRPDGSKVVRVTKKRRVMMTAADKRRESRMHVFLFIAALFVLMLVVSGFVFFRMATMSSTAYLEAKRAELQQLWGASSVQFEGDGIDGLTVKLNTVSVEFPEDSMLQSVELSGVESTLELASYISGIVKGENLNIERARIVLRNGSRMKMPLQNGKDIWQFRRVECADFSVRYADDDSAAMSLENTQAYMYYPTAARSSSVIMLRGGVLDFKGWKKVRIAEGKGHISSKGIDDFSLTGTTDAVSSEAEQRRTSISFAGKIPDGSDLAGPYAVESNNMSLADFTDGRFEKILTARTAAVSHGKINGKFNVMLSAHAAPQFNGELHLRNICLSSFPALMAITEHIEFSKRRMYNPLSLNRGYVVLKNDGKSWGLEIPEGAVAERDLATLQGKMMLSAENELSGEMSYGIPVVLARVEYPDGYPDPIFRQDGEWAVLRTNLKGLGNMPGDDMAEVEARAAIARRDRPARIPFDQLDVNRLTTQMLQQAADVTPNGQEAEKQAESIPSPAPQQNRVPANNVDSIFSNPFEEKEDPFGSQTPF